MAKPSISPLGDSPLAAAFQGRMRVECITRFVCPVCHLVEEMERGLLEQGAQIRHCKACGGKSGQAWDGHGGPPDELAETE